MKQNVLKQIQPRPAIGAFQVQVSTTMSHYVMYVNMCFMGMMFWQITAAPWLRLYVYQGAMFWMFALFMFLFLLVIMLLDWKYMYPSRQAIVNQQAFKHSNPTVAIIKEIRTEQIEMRANQKRIMEKLGIEND